MSDMLAQSLSGLPSGPRGAALAAAVLFLVTLVLGFSNLTPNRAPVADEAWYLKKALQIHDDGADVYTTGTMPAYSMYLATVLSLDEAALRAARCLADAAGADTCVIDLGGVLRPQVLFLALALGVTGWVLFTAFGGMVPAVLGGGFLLYSGPPLAFANHYLTEALSFPLFLMFSAAALSTFRHRSLSLAIASGLLMAALALTRASFLFGILPLVALFVFAPQPTSGGGRPGVVLAGAAAMVFLAITGGFLFQSQRISGAALPTTNKVVLVTRVAYNDLSLREWAAGWVFWLPRVGDRLAERLFPAEDVERLKFDGKDSIYRKVRMDLFEEYRRNGGRAWLLEKKVLGELGWHSAVSLLMAWRASFIAGVTGAFGLLAMALTLFGPWAAAYRGRFLALAAVPVFILGVQAFTAPPIPRYNIFLLLPMAAAIGLLGTRALAGAAALWAGRRGQRPTV